MILDADKQRWLAKIAPRAKHITDVQYAMLTSHAFSTDRSCAWNVYWIDRQHFIGQISWRSGDWRRARGWSPRLSWQAEPYSAAEGRFAVGSIQYCYTYEAALEYLRAYQEALYTPDEWFELLIAEAQCKQRRWDQSDHGTIPPLLISECATDDYRFGSVELPDLLAQ